MNREWWNRRSKMTSLNREFRSAKPLDALAVTNEWKATWNQ